MGKLAQSYRAHRKKRQRPRDKGFMPKEFKGEHKKFMMRELVFLKRERTSIENGVRISERINWNKCDVYYNERRELAKAARKDRHLIRKWELERRAQEAHETLV